MKVDDQELIEAAKVAQIEKNISMPPRGRQHASPVSKHYMELFNQMEPGDSVFFKTKKQAERLRMCFRQHKVPAAVYRVDEGYRVWRKVTKKEQVPNLK